MREVLRAPAGDEREHRVVVRESHLPLRGMHVHVEPVGRHRDPQDRGGEAPVREQVAVRLPQRVADERALDPPPVHEHHLPFACGARVLGEPEQALERDLAAPLRDREPLLRVSGAPHRARALACSLDPLRRHARPIEALLAVDDEPERHPGERHAERLQQPERGADLTRGRVEEFAARRSVEEQIRHLDRGARGAARRSARRDDASLDRHERRALVGRPGVGGRREVIRIRLTAAMLGSASPRNPRVVSRSRSSSETILLVACRSSAISISSPAIPEPSSATWNAWSSEPSTRTSIRRAPASTAFSRISLSAESGRSITSPAAIRDAVSGARRRMVPVAMGGMRSGA